MVYTPPSLTDAPSSSVARALLTLATSSHVLPRKPQWCHPSAPTICPQFLPGAFSWACFPCSSTRSCDQWHLFLRPSASFEHCFLLLSSIWYFPFPSLYDEFFKNRSKFPFSFVPAHLTLTRRHHLHSDSLSSFLSVVDYVSLTILCISLFSLLCLSQDKFEATHAFGEVSPKKWNDELTDLLSFRWKMSLLGSHIYLNSQIW